MITYNGIFAAEINKSVEVLEKYYPELTAADLQLTDDNSGKFITHTRNIHH